MRIRYYVRRTAGFLGFALAAFLLWGALYGIYIESHKGGDVAGFVIMIGFAAVCLYGAIRWVRDRGHGLEYLPPDLNVPGMPEAISRSRSSIQDFIGSLQGYRGRAFIKFPVAYDEGFTEHLWGCVQSFEDEVFDVSPANLPFHGGLIADDRIQVEADAVEDWMLVDEEGRIRGGFSLVAIFNHFDKTGRWLTPRLRFQKSLLLDARRVT
jgi:uncharacterized protein YegJ (DUF2314 family)